MSLVDYASSSSSSSSSSDDDDDDARAHVVAQREGTPAVDMPPQSQSILMPPTGSTTSLRSIVLPDASLLLASPPMSSNIYGGSDHLSRVAVAMAASRKRESNGLAPSLPRNKYPRGMLPHSKIPDASSGLLVPPQLSGRSNVVTEDIGKLFVRKQTAHSTE